MHSHLGSISDMQHPPSTIFPASTSFSNPESGTGNPYNISATLLLLHSGHLLANEVHATCNTINFETTRKLQEKHYRSKNNALTNKLPMQNDACRTVDEDVLEIDLECLAIP